MSPYLIPTTAEICKLIEAGLRLNTNSSASRHSRFPAGNGEEAPSDFQQRMKIIAAERGEGGGSENCRKMLPEQNVKSMG